MIIEEIMSIDIHTLSPDDTIAAALQLCRDYKVRHIPILDREDRLAGLVTDRDIMVTETDVLHTFVELTGVNQPGSRIEITVENKAGVLFDILHVLHHRRVNVQSVLVYPSRDAETHKTVVFRIRTMNPVGVIDDLKKAGHHVLWPNIPGVCT